MKITKCLAATRATTAMIAAALLLTDGARARDLRTTGPMLGPSVSVLNSATMTQPVVSKPAAAATTSAAPKPVAPTIEVRDHAPGGNADPCEKYRCDPGSWLKSAIERYQNNPPRASFCAVGSYPGVCYQGLVYLDQTGHTKTFYMAFGSLHGAPLPGQMEKFLNVLRQAEAKYNGPTYKPMWVNELGTRANGHPRDHRN
jgi:hypothetical protein